MLSKQEIQKKELYRICEENKDVELYQHFQGVRFISTAPVVDYNEVPCICVGKNGNTSRLFQSTDKRSYFFACDGWGEKDGYLIAVRFGGDFRSDQPMDIDKLKEFVKNPPPASGWAGTMKRIRDINTAKSIIEILEQNA